MGPFIVSLIITAFIAAVILFVSEKFQRVWLKRILIFALAWIVALVASAVSIITERFTNNAHYSFMLDETLSSVIASLENRDEPATLNDLKEFRKTWDPTYEKSWPHHRMMFDSLFARLNPNQSYTGQPSLSGRVTLEEPEWAKMKTVRVFASVGTFPPPSKEAYENAKRADTIAETAFAESLRTWAVTPEGATWKDKKPVYPGGDYKQFSTLADANGNYAFESLPNGVCFVSVWFDLENSEQPNTAGRHHRVVIEKGSVARVDISLNRHDIADW